MSDHRKAIDGPESSRDASCAAGEATSGQKPALALTYGGTADEYIAALLARYVSLPATPSSARAVDRRCARGLYLRGVPLEIAQAALVVGTARRTLRRPDRAPLPRVRALHYFLPIVEELLETPMEPDYVAYLARRLLPWMEPDRSS